MSDIDLYSEVKPRYHQLIPVKEDGLILFALFQQFGSHEFNEDQIIQVIEKVFADLGKGGQRTESDRNNQIILRLQDFFLWRDRKRKLYGFKTYGEEFCAKVFKRLSESYHPARIERLFKSLLDTLTSYLPDLPGWVQDHFNRISADLALQVEILDQQVNESVNLFRQQIKQPQTDILALIDLITAGLDQIKAHAGELTNAFRATYDIDDLMQVLLKDQENVPIFGQVELVLKHNRSVREHLDQVSQRIDKIKPRIREFIFEFNQRELDRKTDRFLHYLLDRSTYVKQDVRRLTLPEGVPGFCYGSVELEPRFYFVPLRQLARRSPVLPQFRQVDEDGVQVVLQKNARRLAFQEKIRTWCQMAVERLERDGRLDFSPFFFELLCAEGQDVQLGIKVAERLVRRFQDRQTFAIQVDTTEYRDPKFDQLFLWNMSILKK